MSIDLFYRDFEAAFRGDRQEIIGRLEVYLDFILPLLEVSVDRRAIDLGCGRGEWLELTGQSGFKSHGVDLDQGMLEDCHTRGLSAEFGDAIAYLSKLPDASQAIVSGFHIAEHLPFEVLQQLIQQALRVLEPGGLLILETPNAENLRVGTLSFHMDPTHNKPLPPGLLSFLPRHYGFERSLVVRLQESSALRSADRASLFEVFEGVSPDYAVVAQKAAAPNVLERFDAAFAKDRGLTLETLAGRFESQLVRQAEFQTQRAEVEQHRVDIEQHRVDIEQHRVDIEQQRREIDELRAEFTARVDAVYASTSWRITAPVRQLGAIARSAKSGVRALVSWCRGLTRSAGLSLVGTLNKRPALRRGVVGAIRRVPGLELVLRKLLADRQQGDLTISRHAISSQLTPRAQSIHTKIQHLRGQR